VRHGLKEMSHGFHKDEAAPSVLDERNAAVRHRRIERRAGQAGGAAGFVHGGAEPVAEWDHLNHSFGARPKVRGSDAAEVAVGILLFVGLDPLPTAVCCGVLEPLLCGRLGDFEIMLAMWRSLLWSRHVLLDVGSIAPQPSCSEAGRCRKMQEDAGSCSGAGAEVFRRRRYPSVGPIIAPQSCRNRVASRRVLL
jgi:hypothetical protein